MGILEVIFGFKKILNFFSMDFPRILGNKYIFFTELNWQLNEKQTET